MVYFAQIDDKTPRSNVDEDSGKEVAQRISRRLSMQNKYCQLNGSEQEGEWSLPSTRIAYQ